MTSGLTPEIVVQLMQTGMRQTDIAREYSVSRQYVNKLAKEGGHDPVTTLVTENFPWPITEGMYHNTIYQALRLLGHYNINPEGLNGTSLVKLRGFLRKLTLFSQVVDYDPAYPAIPGLSNTPGFAYLPRTEEDGNYAVRFGPGVTPTPLGKKMWTLPESIP